MIGAFFRTVLPLGVAAGATFLGILLIRYAPEGRRRPPEDRTPLVRIETVQPGTVSLDVRTYGVVRPAVETTLLARVAGEVVYVAPSFRDGGFFSAGEVLLKVERRDYELRRTEASALVAEAQALSDRIQAEAEMARKEWEAYGKGKADPLALKEPQLVEAKARLEAAKARLVSADLDLERTEIRAPYDGRVRSRRVDRGDVLAPGAVVAEIYATDSVEVRLPIPDAQLAYLDLPLSASDGGAAAAGPAGPPVRVLTTFAGREWEWTGRVVRTEAEVDARSRVVYAVARVEKPFAATDDRPPLLPGMFVEAIVAGRQVEAFAGIPEEAFLAESRVLVVNGEDRLEFRPVEVLRREGEGLVTARGLKAGDRVCLTELASPTEGTKVRIHAASDLR